jgi:hypothetical protein
VSTFPITLSIPAIYNLFEYEAHFTITGWHPSKSVHPVYVSIHYVCSREFCNSLGVTKYDPCRYSSNPKIVKFFCLHYFSCFRSLFRSGLQFVHILLQYLRKRFIIFQEYRIVLHSSRNVPGCPINVLSLRSETNFNIDNLRHCNSKRKKPNVRQSLYIPRCFSHVYFNSLLLVESSSGSAHL